MLRDYYVLTKPGIIRGNVMTTLAGFLLAAQGHISFGVLLAVSGGTALVIASACVFNNVIDRDIDKKMVRTAKRALVTGTIAIRSALVYAVVLGIAGFIVLLLFTNVLTTVLGFIGFVSYVVFYGYAKRHSVHGTLVGTIPGAMPLVSGYTAVTNHFDTGALLLFLIMVAWQMPHFYGIAIYRLKDYAAAGLPVMPVKKGIRTTKLQIMLYVLGFAAMCGLLSIFGYAGSVFAVVMSIVSAYWLYLGAKGWKSKDDTKWARGMFGFSLIALLVMSVLLSIESLVP
ncbi:MAG: heme o synthase [Candidatus Saccharimonadales bacterium]